MFERIKFDQVEDVSPAVIHNDAKLQRVPSLRGLYDVRLINNGILRLYVEEKQWTKDERIPAMEFSSRHTISATSRTCVFLLSHPTEKIIVSCAECLRRRRSASCDRAASTGLRAITARRARNR